MILYLTFIIISLTITIWVAIDDKEDKRPKEEKQKDFNRQCVILLSGILWLINIIMTLIIVLNHTTFINKLEYTKTMEEIKSLEYSKNTILEIKDNESKKIAIIEYNDKVKEFNIKIIEKKENLKNLWINWYTPEYYKDIELIEYIR